MPEEFPSAALLKRMAAAGLREEDLEEQFTLGSGPGGQKINKTSVCVRVLHRPSGQEARCQESRFRKMNRIRAREILCQRFEEMAEAARLERQRLRALKRAMERKPSAGEKRRRREAKNHRSETKAARRRPGED